MSRDNLKSKFYFVVFLMSVALMAFIFNFKVKAQMIEVGCAEIAAKSSSLYSKNIERQIDDVYTYENLKARCVQEYKYTDSLKNNK